MDAEPLANHRILRNNCAIIPRNTDYGQWWNTNELGLEWYQTIYGYRRKTHEYFIDWFRRNAEGEQLNSVLEVGCGRAYPFAKLFSDRAYTGIDISAKEIDWCRQKYPQHDFWCGDFLAGQFSGTSDLAISHAVIDHVYDINLVLKRMIGAARRCIFIVVSGLVRRTRTAAIRRGQIGNLFP
jgi:SAM-dependent methyltransferase